MSVRVPGRRVRAVLGVSALALATAACTGAPVSDAPPRADVAEVAALPLAQQAALLGPLRGLAGALTAQRGRFAASFTGVDIDAPADTVALWTTGRGTGAQVLAAARRADPGASWSKVRLEVSRFSRRTLDAAAAALTTAPGSGALTRIEPATDGSRLTADLASDVAPDTLPARIAGVPVVYQSAAPTVSKSGSVPWAYYKWHDRTPFIGGDVLTSNGQRYCTAGLPAIRRSNGQPVMIGAAHCFPIGQRVYTGGGTTGAYGNGQVGNYVGTVTARDQTWDAETIVGANNNADESDTSTWLPLHGVAYSYDGDYVCQDGAASFFLGHPTPCGIEVTDDDLWFRISDYWARGVEGIDYAHGWGSHGGDSGGTVFAVLKGGVRQVRGIVSSGGADGTTDQRRVDWTEAVDIFRAYGLTLNPTT